MAFSLLALLRAAVGRRPKLLCEPRLWAKGISELRRRAGGRRESGAFLLGHVKGKRRRVEQFLFYDDIDPTCFNNGIVEFDGARFGQVWARCRELNMTVVADVHVHPGHFSQSSSDQDNPMIAEAGHLALIIPNFARGNGLPGKIGIYEYQGSRRWKSFSALRRKKVNDFFTLNNLWSAQLFNMTSWLASHHAKLPLNQILNHHWLADSKHFCNSFSCI